MAVGDSRLDAQIAATDGAVVTRWAVVAETIGPDGSEDLRVATSPHLPAWAVGGMLRFAADLNRPAGCSYEPLDD